MSSPKGLPHSGGEGVFNMFRGNYDRYNEDDFGGLQTPPSCTLTEPPKVPFRKSKFYSLHSDQVKEHKPVTVQAKGITVKGFNIQTSQAAGSPAPAHQAAESCFSGSLVQDHKISSQVLKGKLSPVTNSGISERKLYAQDTPHGSIEVSPSSTAAVKRFEKAHQITTLKSLSQPSSPRSSPKLSRKASESQLSNALTRFAEQSALMKQNKTSPASGQQFKTGTDSVDGLVSMRAHPESLHPNSSVTGTFGSWLWGKNSKVVVENKDINAFSPTSF